MRRLLLIFFWTALIGQKSPTVPKNVFRFSIEKNYSVSKWDLDKQNFDLQGIGRHYFDNITHNDSVRFSSDYDLYHNGSFLLDSSITIEEWMTNFNISNGTDLPVFEAILLDTASAISVLGEILESREKTINRKKYQIEYGMSDDITLNISLPINDKYSVDRSISATSMDIEGIDNLISYHNNAQSQLYNFINSNSFSDYSQSLRDTIKMIYGYFYKDTSNHNVLWALESGNNPLQTGISDSRFYSDLMNTDTINLDSLITFFYPLSRSTSGLDDMELGITYLLFGKPSWTIGDNLKALYGQLRINIPYGNTISSYSQSGIKQFKEIGFGSGVTRLSFGLMGELAFGRTMKGITYFNSYMTMSSSELLNTSVGLFSGGHSHPDSILSQVGVTYKFKEGNWINNNFGLQLEPGPDRIRILIELNFVSKQEDTFSSKSKYWDNWMASHDGYETSFKRTDFKIEFWILNSISRNKIGPFAFDIYGGYKNTTIAESTYKGWTAYAGITTFFQAW